MIVLNRQKFSSIVLNPIGVAGAVYVMDIITSDGDVLGATNINPVFKPRIIDLIILD